MTANIFDLERNSFVDGPGIRTTVFFKGCNLRCEWCHNPESQSASPEMLFYKNKCTLCGKCKEKCPNGLEKCDLCGKCELYCPSDARKICGKKYTVAEILKEALKDRIFYENSGGGITLSGGECMLQIDFIEELLTACRAEGIHTAVDTAGHVPFGYFERIIPYTNLFLYDIKCFDSDRHKLYTGVGNELIMSNLAALLEMGVPIWIRIPVIPGCNDDIKGMRKIKEFLDAHGKPEKVELLPYHAMGEHKYSAIGKNAKSFCTPSEEQMAKLREIFE